LKRLLAIATLLVLATMLIPTAVFAADPTTFVVNWSGAGAVNGTSIVKNDAVYSFSANAGLIQGNFSTIGYNDNPYGYNVDTSKAYIQSNVAGGSTWFNALRTDAYTPAYGAAGQQATSFVGSSETGSMATGSWNNYANMGNGTYAQPHTPLGYNYEASGANFTILSYIGSNGGATVSDAGFALNPAANNAYLLSTGNGTAKINDMTNEAWAGGVNFGLGGGCYTNANAALTGSGQFLVNATGTNSITSGGWNVGGSGAYGSANFQAVAKYAGNTSVADYSLTVR
jgi:hypothetical protein